MKNFLLKTISVFEIVGGTTGILFLILWFLANPFNIYSLFLFPIPIAIYCLSIYAGLGLWKEKRRALLASIFIQIIQIPKIISPLIIFMFSFGFDFWIQFIIAPTNYTNLGFEFRFLSFNQLFFNNKNVPIGFGVSITALIFLFILLKYKPQVAKNTTKSEPPPPPNFNQTIGA